MIEINQIYCRCILKYDRYVLITKIDLFDKFVYYHIYDVLRGAMPPDKTLFSGHIHCCHIVEFSFKYTRYD